jgi:hypothetical protein
MIRRIPDNFFLGAVLGIFFLAVSYFLLYNLRLLFVAHYDNPYLFAEPRTQLFSILANLIFFRFMVVNFKKESMGKGILFSTVIIAFIYFFLYSRYHFRMESKKQEYPIALLN